MKDDAKEILIFFGCLAIGPLFILMTIINGFVLMKLWEWFIVERFGLVELTIPHAIGITLIISLVTQDISKKTADKEDDKRKIIGKMVGSGLGPFLVLLIGYIVQMFI